MLVLARCHMRHNNLTPQQFLRATYMWKFDKDISDLSLTNDTKLFVEQGVVPPYAIAYLLFIYGDTSCE